MERLVTKANCIFSMQGLMFHARGWVPVDEAQVAIYRDEMRANITKYATAHNTMFTLANAAGGTQAASWAAPYVTITRWDVSVGRL